MADKKVSELDAIAGSATAADDLFLIVDSSGSVTKKITRAELNNAIEQDVLSTVDINGGAIDNTVIGGATPAAGNFTTLGANGSGTFVNFISSSNSAYVRLQNSVATGGYLGYQNAALQLWAITNAKGFQLDGTSNDISFYDSTGTTQGFYWDASTQRLGLGTTAPAHNVEIVATAAGSVNDSLQIRNNATSSGTGSRIRFINSTDANSDTNGASISSVRNGNDNDLVFETENAERMRLTSAGFLGLGTAAPDSNHKLEVASGGTAEAGIRSGNTSEAILNFGRTNDRLRGRIAYNNSSEYMAFWTNQGEKMRLTSAGSLGLGVSSPSAGLHVEDDNGAIVSRSGYSQYLQFQPANNSVPTILGLGGNGVHIGPTNSTGIRINNSGSVGIGTATPAFSRTGGGLRIDNSDAPHIRLDNGSSNVSEIYQSGVNTVIDSRSPSGVIKFTVQDSEKMRLSSGNLLVGGTSLGENGAVTMGGDGRIYAIRASDTAGFFGRTSSDGSIVNFTKDGSTVGGIYTFSNELALVSGNTGLYFDDANNKIFPLTGSGNVRDNITDLGASNARFKDGYFAGNIRTDSTLFAPSFTCYPNGSAPTADAAIYRPQDGTLGFVSNGSEKARFASDGNLYIAKTSDTATGVGLTLSGGGFIRAVRNEICGVFNRQGSDGTLLSFARSNSGVGAISVTTSATTYNTSSDRRLKSNIQDAASASDKIDAIQVRQFDWNIDDSHQDYGLIAQELQPIEPLAVTGDADSDEMMGVDYSKLVPMLIKEIQELRGRVATLEAN